MGRANRPCTATHGRSSLVTNTSVEDTSTEVSRF